MRDKFYVIFVKNVYIPEPTRQARPSPMSSTSTLRGQPAATDVFAELLATLESATESIRDSLTQLEGLYCLDTDLPQFLRARHRLFSETFLYGQFGHVDLVRVFNTVYEVMEVMCQVSEPSEVFECLQATAIDCQAALKRATNLETKYDRILRNVEQLQRQVDADILGLSEDRTGILSPGDRATRTERNAEQIEASHGFFNTLSTSILRLKLLEFMRSTLGINSLQQRETEDGRILLQLVGKSVLEFRTSLNLMCDMLRTGKALLETGLSIIQSCDSISDWSESLKTRNKLKNACRTFLVMKTGQERVLYSLEDKVVDEFKQEWLQKLNNNNVSGKIVAL